MVSLSLSPAGTSNQIKTGWKERELPFWGPVSLNSQKQDFMVTPLLPLPLVIPDRNQREEERAASADQRC